MLDDMAPGGAEISETVRRVRDSFLTDGFAKLCGMELLEITEGYSKVRMAITDSHRNSHGTAHGGAIFALADYASGAAANSLGKVAVSLGCNVSYLRPGKKGFLIAEAKTINSSSKTSTQTVEVRDERGKLVALFNGTSYRLDKKSE